MKTPANNSDTIFFLNISLTIAGDKSGVLGIFLQGEFYATSIY